MTHTFAIVAGFCGGYFGFSRHQPGIALDNKTGGAVLSLRHVLRNLGHLPLGGDTEVAAIFMQGAVKQGK